MAPTSSELVISTYNNPRSLRLCLDAVTRQQVMPTSICFADDGSRADTKAVIDGFAVPGVTVRHVWHEDTGFRKCEILNKAVATSMAEYLIFIDGDLVIHPGFLKRHLDMAQPGQFQCGSAIRLSKAMTDRILSREQIVLDGKGRPEGWVPRGLSEWLKAMPLPAGIMGWLDRVSPVKCSWAGGNASTFRAHILAVNGFDTRMAYGGEDKEFGARLTNAGIKGRHLRYTAPAYHLEHSRGYMDAEMKRRNREIIEATRATGKVRTENGIMP